MSLLRAGLPREHGLIAWTLQPLLLGVALAPSASTLLTAVGVVAGFWTFNVHRSQAPGAPAGAAVAGVALGGAVLAGAPLLPIVGLTLAGASAVLAGPALGRLPRHAGFEVAGILALVSAGATVAAAGGAAPAAIVVTSGVLTAWEIVGLVWVRAQLARLLPQRRPLPSGGWVAGGAVLLALVAGAVVGHLGVALLPLVYPLRTIAHAPLTRAADARRAGLTELGWGIGAVVAAALLVRVS